MVEILKDRICIKRSDIEYSLYKYWIFYRLDINRINVTQKQQLIQKRKVFLNVLFNVLNIIRFLLYIHKSKPNNYFPVYYFDIFQYLGTIKEFIYISAA